MQNRSMTWNEWMAVKVVAVNKRRRKEVTVPEGQMGLGI
jgi:hypothetical protein